MANLHTGRQVLVSLGPRQRSLIREGLEELHAAFTFSDADEAIYRDLMVRIPDPKGER